MPLFGKKKPTPEEQIITVREKIHNLVRQYSAKQITFDQLKAQVYQVMRYEFPLNTFIQPEVRIYMLDHSSLPFVERLTCTTVMQETMERIRIETSR